MSQDGIALPGLNGDTEPVARQRDLTLDGARDVQHAMLHVLSVAVYTTELPGTSHSIMKPAAALWGTRPTLNSGPVVRSWRMYWPDGTPLPHDECPMAVALKEKRNFGTDRRRSPNGLTERAYRHGLSIAAARRGRRGRRAEYVRRTSPSANAARNLRSASPRLSSRGTMPSSARTSMASSRAGTGAQSGSSVYVAEEVIGKPSRY